MTVETTRTPIKMIKYELKPSHKLSHYMNHCCSKKLKEEDALSPTTAPENKMEADVIMRHGHFIRCTLQLNQFGPFYLYNCFILYSINTAQWFGPYWHEKKTRKTKISPTPLYHHHWPELLIQVRMEPSFDVVQIQILPSWISQQKFGWNGLNFNQTYWVSTGLNALSCCHVSGLLNICTNERLNRCP